MIHLETITLPHDLSTFTEIIDVRSPDEYTLDHIPGAINLPVLDNLERQKVGKLYKENPFEARKLGAALISRNVANHLEQRLSENGPEYTPLLYCWRGGMRSRSMTVILKSIGWHANILQGGYRSFRQSVVGDLDNYFNDSRLDLRVISGFTGVGKTRLLHAIQAAGGQILDLEGLANHKGSLLGNPPKDTQPSQKKFETSLWAEMSKLDLGRPIYIEAESNRIGNVHCPAGLWLALHSAQVTHIDLPLDQRIILLREEYPHFQEEPQKLLDLLEVLVRLRGRTQVTEWQQMINTKEWDSFVKSILVKHYDLSYRQPGHEKSNYQPVSNTVNIKDSGSESYAKAALEILATESVTQDSDS